MTPSLESGPSGFFLDAERRPRTIWRLAICLAGCLFVQVVAAIAVILILVLHAVLSGGDLKDLALSFRSPAHYVELQGLAALPTAALLLLWVWVCRRFLDGRSLVSIGFAAPRAGWPSTVLWGTFAGALPILLSVCVLLSAHGILLTGVTTSWQTWFLIPVLLLMAFSEEIVFRGYLLRNFLESGRPILGLVLGSFVFALVHGFNPAVWSSAWGPINLFGAGVVLSMAYLLSDDLWFPTVLHFTWNLTQGVVFQLPISGLVTDGILDVEVTGRLPVWWTGGDFGLESSLLVTFAEVVLAAVLAVLWRRAQGGRRPPSDAGSGDLSRT